MDDFDQSLKRRRRDLPSNRTGPSTKPTGSA